MLGPNRAVNEVYIEVLSWPVIDILKRKLDPVKVMCLSQVPTGNIPYFEPQTSPFQGCHVVTVTIGDDPK